MARLIPNLHAFCHACGTAYKNPKDLPAPRNCRECGTTRWFNPSPISVLMQPVLDEHSNIGILIGQRNIAPKEGEWALIGGFVEWMDQSYESAALREKNEEIQSGPHTPLFHDDGATLLFSMRGDVGQMIAFSQANRIIRLEELGNFQPNAETRAVSVAWSPQDLCFSSHTVALMRWFEMMEEGEDA